MQVSMWGVVVLSHTGRNPPELGLDLEHRLASHHPSFRTRGVLSRPAWPHRREGTALSPSGGG